MGSIIPRLSFTTARGAGLGYRRVGAGSPLVCVPGGPLLPADYLGELGGLSEFAELVLFDPPGSGRSAGDAADEVFAAACLCDRIADDLEALRLHLGLEHLSLLAHSAGANIALRYAERYPDRVGRLLLVSPSTRAVGIEITDDARSAVARSRSSEPWFGEASVALTRIQAGDPLADDWTAIAPFSFGHWSPAAAAYNAAMDAAIDPTAAAAFGAPGAFDPPATRAALATLHAPVAIIAGAVDVGLPVVAMEELAALFPRAALHVLPDAGHYPWFDQPEAFVAAARLAISA